MKIAIVGTGHVGLITGATLAGLGHDVVGTDASAEKVATLRRGEAPFYEPGLDELLQGGLVDGHLSFADTIAEALEGTEVVFVCVGRPPVGLGDRSLTAVEESAREIARASANGVVLVVKSTVPPGTTGRIEKVVRMERPELDFVAVSSPEFLREGHAIEDTLRPDRLVIGSDDPRGFDVLERLYEPLLEAGVRVIRTDPRTAELSKLASNAFLASKISFANAMARVSELAGADVDGVTEIMGADPRIGPAFLRAGIGYGGYCLPKDVVTLERVAERLGYDFGLLREAGRVNDEALKAVARKVEEAVWNIEGKTVALFGVAFKPETDDVRGAPALALAELLLAEGARCRRVRPHGRGQGGGRTRGARGGRRPVRGRRRRRLRGVVHGVGRVPRSGPASAQRRDDAARDGRRSEPAGPRRAGGGRVLLSPGGPSLHGILTVAPHLAPP